MSEINIPPEVLEAMQKAYSEAVARGTTADGWTAAIRAALNAWPYMIDYSTGKYGLYGPHLILPLTENTDD